MSLSLAEAYIVASDGTQSANLVCNGFHQIEIDVQFEIECGGATIDAETAKKMCTVSFIDYDTGEDLRTNSTPPTVDDAHDPLENYWWWSTQPGVFFASYESRRLEEHGTSAAPKREKDQYLATDRLYLSTTCPADTTIGFKLVVNGAAVGGAYANCGGTLTFWQNGDLNGSGLNITAIPKSRYKCDDVTSRSDDSTVEGYFKTSFALTNFYFQLGWNGENVPIKAMHYQADASNAPGNGGLITGGPTLYGWACVYYKQPYTSATEGVPTQYALCDLNQNSSSMMWYLEIVPIPNDAKSGELCIARLRQESGTTSEIGMTSLHLKLFGPYGDSLKCTAAINCAGYASLGEVELIDGWVDSWQDLST